MTKQTKQDDLLWQAAERLINTNPHDHAVQSIGRKYVNMHKRGYPASYLFAETDEIRVSLTYSHERQRFDLHIRHKEDYTQNIYVGGISDFDLTVLYLMQKLKDFAVSRNYSFFNVETVAALKIAEDGFNTLTSSTAEHWYRLPKEVYEQYKEQPHKLSVLFLKTIRKEPLIA